MVSFFSYFFLCLQCLYPVSGCIGILFCGTSWKPSAGRLVWGNFDVVNALVTIRSVTSSKPRPIVGPILKPPHVEQIGSQSTHGFLCSCTGYEQDLEHLSKHWPLQGTWCSGIVCQFSSVGRGHECRTTGGGRFWMLSIHSRPPHLELQPWFPSIGG